MNAQTIVNRYNKRIKSLGKRNFEFRSEHFSTMFSRIIRQNNIGTEKDVLGEYSKGMISAKKFSELEGNKRNKLIKQLDTLMKESTVKSMRTSFAGMKEGMKTAFANKGINIDNLSDAQYNDLWNKLQTMSQKFTGQRYTSDQDQDQDILESVSTLYSDYQNDVISKEQLDELFDDMMQSDNASAALDFVLDFELEMMKKGVL